MRRFGWRRFVALLPILVCTAGGSTASAVQIWMKDGRILEGKEAPIQSLLEIPRRSDPGKAGSAKLIVLVDDELRRTFVPKRQIQQMLPKDSTEIFERFRIHQQVLRQGRTVKSVGPIREVETFDEFGRRTIEMNTNRGPEQIIQCITEITPLWTKVEGHLHVWDMRMATSSIRADTLAGILAKQTNSESVDERVKIASFYLQCERYEQAYQELERILGDFPNDDEVRKRLEPRVTQIRQLGSKRLLDELSLRRDAGQHRLVVAKLKDFPSEGVAGSILEGVREMRRDYESLEAQRTESLERLDEFFDKVADEGVRQRIEPIREEIRAELNWNTVGRLSAFRRMAGDEGLLPEEKLALAISGWLLGPDSATEKLPVALSVFEVRGLILQYLRAEDTLSRARVLERFRSEEGGTPTLVARLLAHMKPPIETPPLDFEGPSEEEPATYTPTRTKLEAQADPPSGDSPPGDEPQVEADSTDATPAVPERPGYCELEVPGLSGAPPVRYVVQLPPEYDPYRRYPTIVTLHGSGSAPDRQIDWWAGAWTSEGWRAGQATRHGYILIAPNWAAEHQTKYGYSAQEHAAVLNCLRDAFRRFAIDTDRVFLTGHSMGGDAAWDLGLAHPDLWAGVIPIVARSDRYCARYWQNAELVPFYFVCGELDGGKMSFNSSEFDRYLKGGYNCTVVEYLGRGHEHFSDEIQRLFDWMGRFRRDFYPKEFTASTMRYWDDFFWWVELDQLPPKAMVDPVDWPPPRGTQPVETTGRMFVTDTIYIRTGAGMVRVWLSPEMVSFERRPNIVVNTRRLRTRADDDSRDPFEDLDLQRETILEDVRTRGDRQHPFWAKIESATGRVAARR